jgi:hypothetical protein
LRKVSVTALKDEAPYIVEWVAYQKLIGFDDIVITTNDCSDGSDRIVERLARHGLCDAVDFSAADHPTSPQLAAYDLIVKRPALAAPCLLLVSDVDEFLQINTGDGTLNALLDAAPPFDLMFVRWRLFGSAGQGRYADDLVTQRFRRASPRRYRKQAYVFGTGQPADPADIPTQGAEAASQVFDRDESLRWSRTYKTLFRYVPGDRLSPHLPRTSRGMLRRVDGGGRTDPDERYSYLRFHGANTIQESYALCQMNHYCNRSAEEYLMKMLRGDGIHAKDPRGLQHWKVGECNEVVEPGMDRWADRLRQLRDEIVEQCGLRPLLDAAAQTRRDRLAGMIAGSREFADLARLLQDLAGADFPASVQVP